MLIQDKTAQATVEYLLLLSVIVFILLKVIGHVRDIFYGWGSEYGAVEFFIMTQVVDKLSTNLGGWY